MSSGLADINSVLMMRAIGILKRHKYGLFTGELVAEMGVRSRESKLVLKKLLRLGAVTRTEDMNGDSREWRWRLR
jgi:hypothetical protein